MKRTGCDGLLGLLLGHNFQVGYTKRTIPPESMAGLGGLSVPQAEKLLIARTAQEEKAEFAYCVRCGTIPPGGGRP